MPGGFSLVMISSNLVKKRLNTENYHPKLSGTAIQVSEVGLELHHPNCVRVWGEGVR